MTDLTGKLIANTYKDLLTVNTSTTNTGLDNNLRKVQDGAGNNSSLKLSQTDAAFTGNVSVNGNLTVEGTFQPDTVNTNELQATRISATSITTNHLTAGTLIFQDVSVSSLRTGNLYAANISAGTVSATNINATNITVAGDNVATSSALASVNDALVSVEALISSNIVFILNAQSSVLTILAGLSATDVNLQNNINSVSTTVSAVNVQVGINATQINTLSTSITANASAIVVNSDAITSINSVIATGAFASVGTSATLETRIAAVSSTMATSINNSNTAITNLSATLESRIAAVSNTMAASIASTSAALESHINTVSATLSIANVSIAANSSQIAAVSVLTKTNKDAVTSINAILGDGSAYASAGTSATLETRIAAVSATMATSINNSNSAIAALSATMATSINNSNTNIAAVSVLTKTNKDAITSINVVLGDGSAYASAGTSATLETRIATVSATMATSINNSNTNITTNTQAITSINGVLGDGSAYASAGTSATLQTKIAAVSSTLATSIGNSNTNIAAVSVLTKTNKDAITSINSVLGSGAFASAGTSATLETRIAAVSSTMATSIGNSNSAITALSATMATSIGNSNSAITALSATMATSIATRLALAGGTMTGNLILNADPSANLQAASKQYVDNLTASSIHVHEAVRVETNTTNLNATYNNGTAGVGATLTNAGTQAALAIDDVTLNTSDRVLVTGQTNQTQNGIYVVTNTGSGSTNWILTRSDDADTSGDGSPDTLDEGSYFFVQEGTVGAAHAFVCNTQGTIVFGTTNITFAQFSDSVEYTAGTGININSSRVVSTSGVATSGQLTTLSATMATSINNSNTNITTNAAAITSINGVLGSGAFASAGTSATLQTKINAVSATMATSINNSNLNITTNANAITSINGVLETGAFASAGTSATLQTKIATLSATMATSINNSNTNIAAVSVLTKTNKDAITSINSVLGTGAFASAGTSATLQTKINAVSATMATSIATVSATLESRIAGVSAIVPTSLTELGITDGSNKQVLQTNGNNVFTFVSVAAGPPEASILEYNYTATAGQTTFSGADDNGNTLSYIANNLIVTLNGIVLENGADYTATNGTSIVLTTAAELNDELNIIAFKTFVVDDTVPASTGGTFNGNVAVNADLSISGNTTAAGATFSGIVSASSLSISGNTTAAGATFSGIVSASSFDSDSVTIGSGVTLQESTDRADLLQITSNTSSWGGLQIRNSSNEGRWSFMTDGESAGIYNDEDSQWHIFMTEGQGVILRYAAADKLTTTSSGVNITGNLAATGSMTAGAKPVLTNIASSNGSTSGYIRLSSGLIIQWGRATSGTGPNARSFPISFPSNCTSVQATSREAYYDVYVTSFNTSSFTPTVRYTTGSGNVAKPIFYIATGY